MAGVLALAALALVGVCALVSGSGPLRSVLDFTQTTVNCDGSVDITTLATGAPCPAGIVPTTMSYTSFAPYVAPPMAVPAYIAPPPQPWGAAPVAVGPNAFQYATVWQGDHVLSGGQPEWAAEDAAQHALNLDNWRIKILHAKREQARLNGDIQRISGSNTDSGNGYGNGYGYRHYEGVGNQPQLQQQNGKRQESKLDKLQNDVKMLAADTTKALGALASEIDKEGKSTPEVGAVLLLTACVDAPAVALALGPNGLRLAGCVYAPYILSYTYV